MGLNSFFSHEFWLVQSLHSYKSDIKAYEHCSLYSPNIPTIVLSQFQIVHAKRLVVLVYDPR